MKDSVNSTPSYVELTSQTFGLMINAITESNQRALALVKSIYEVSSRPYATGAPEAAIKDGFERANQIVELTAGAMQQTVAKRAELAEKMVAHSAAWQEQYTQALRGLVTTGLSNIGYVREAAETQLNGFTKRVEELQTAGINAN